MAFSTITEEQQENMGVTGLPDTPALDTHDMQAKFDELGNAAIDWIQRFVTELEAATAAASVGCAVPPGIAVTEQKLQNVIAAIARLAVSNDDKAHSHANKATLDSITDTVKAKYDIIASVFGNVTTFDSEVLVPTALSVPSSQAVATYVQAFNIATKLLAQAYPVGSCYIGTTSPALFLGGTWTEVTDTGISPNYTVWKRTA